MVRKNASLAFIVFHCQAIFLDVGLHKHLLLCNAVDKHAPPHNLVLTNNDKPWVTAKFKECVHSRNQAFATDNIDLYRRMRNQVNRLRQQLRTQFFKNKLNNLKTVDNKKWWSEIKTICGFNVKHKDDFSSVVINDEVLSNNLSQILSMTLLLLSLIKYPSLIRIYWQLWLTHWGNVRISILCLSMMFILY